MIKETKVFKTDSYFNTFNILRSRLKEFSLNPERRGIIFCEEKISLLAENFLCDEINGSFSIDVFSFGNYLRKKYSGEKVLSKEGSTMVVKRLIKSLELKCFMNSKNGLATSLFNLILQLKSAKVTLEDVQKAIALSKGVLKNKLIDVFEIYSAYENFIRENGYDDQSSLLTRLPPIIENDNDIKDTDVILLGYTSWTRQTLSVISSLFKTAKSVTLIVTGGENGYSFVNEVEGLYLNECKRLNVKAEVIEVLSDYRLEAKRIADNIFNPSAFSLKKMDNDCVYRLNATDPKDEIKKVASIIKSKVIEEGARYQDFSIAINDTEKLKHTVEKIFSDYDIPYFLDAKKKGENTPLVSLILSYIEAFRKNLKREEVCAFIKNPIFLPDKNYADVFENYVLTYNINFNQFKKPFTLAGKGEDLVKLNLTRAKLVDLFSSFDVRKMLDKLNAISAEEEFSLKLQEIGLFEQASINKQIYEAVIGILDEMDLILGKVDNPLDFKESFVSGINALELSILPQFKDAVFIGGYREVALLQGKYVFALNLNADVPSVKEDVAILSDKDIDVLSSFKVLVEPKIKIVNHRSRENIAMALSSFKNSLYLCCPTLSESGKISTISEVFSYFENMFDVKEINECKQYLTLKEGIETFGKDCISFLEGNPDLENASNFYYACKGVYPVERIVEKANAVLTPLILKGHSLAKNVTSPTSIENYAKCPYRAFIEQYLGVNAKDVGEITPPSLGTLAHAVFEQYVKNIDKVKDKESSDICVDDILNELLKKDEYLRFLNDEREEDSLKRARREIKEYCFKIFSQFEKSEFKPLYVEKSFGSNREGSLPPIELLKGRIKLKGKIDRVDEKEGYIRVVDYKTGKVDKNREELFSGKKLQLYLYPQVFKDKTIAGTFYMPINGGYTSEEDLEKSTLYAGDVLDDDEILLKQDSDYERGKAGKILPIKIVKGEIRNAYSNDKLTAFSKYALKMAEKTASYMEEGFISPSPLDNECEYCQFMGLCDDNFTCERELLKVTDETVINAVSKEEKEDE